MTETADVIIVGGGLEGTAAAWRLAQRGVTDVVVLERDTVGAGGTGKSSGVVRCHYGVSSLARMATTSLETFENAADLFGTDIGFRQTGYSWASARSTRPPCAPAWWRSARWGLTTSEIDRSEVASLWPGMYTGRLRRVLLGAARWLRGRLRDRAGVRRGGPRGPGLGSGRVPRSPRSWSAGTR